MEEVVSLAEFANKKMEAVVNLADVLEGEDGSGGDPCRAF